MDPKDHQPWHILLDLVLPVEQVKVSHFSEHRIKVGTGKSFAAICDQHELSVAGAFI